MSDCTLCETAKVRVTCIFDEACPGCKAREVSRSPWFAGSMRAGRLTGTYRRHLELTGLTHEQVKAAHAADAINRKALT